MVEDDSGKRLLQLGVEDIGEKVIFDGQESERKPFGNKISCESTTHRAAWKTFENGSRADYQDRIDRVTLSRPLVSDKDKTTVQRRIYPSEARERLTTYRAKLTAVIRWKVFADDGSATEYEEVRECGLLPVMVRVGPLTWPSNHGCLLKQ